MSNRQAAVQQILADPKLTGYQKARKINNLIKMHKTPKEAKRYGKITETSRVHTHQDQQAVPKKTAKAGQKKQA